MKCLLIVASLAVIANGLPTSYQPEYKYDPQPYNFDYAVKDDYAYLDFGHQQSGDSYGNAAGSYFVLLPDGRVQTVTYTADEYGYKADVSYSGEPKYDAYKPAASYKPAPAYAPAPYEPAPYHPAPAAYEPAPYKPAPVYDAPYHA